MTTIAAGTERVFWTDPADVPDEVRDDLIKILTVQLSSEFSTRQFAPWLFAAPPEEKLDEARSLADEYRHGHEIRQILLDLDFQPDDLIVEAQESIESGRRKLDLFKIPIESWNEMQVFRYLGEWAGALQALAGMGSRYLPYAIWCARTFQDEGLHHFEMGRRRLKELARGPQHRESLKTAVEKWYPLMIDMFGGSETENEKRYLAHGLKTLTNTELRLAWMEDVLPTLLENDLAPEDPYQGNRHRYSDLKGQVIVLRENSN